MAGVSKTLRHPGDEERAAGVAGSACGMAPFVRPGFRKPQTSGGPCAPNSAAPTGRGIRIRRYVGWFVIAGVFLVIGVGGLIASTTPQTSTTTFTLQPQTGYCTYHRFDTLTGGPLTVIFSASPGIVDQYVMTDVQETAYYAGSGLTYIAQDSGASGTFTTSLPSGGTYYVLSCHGSGYESTTQTGTHTMTLAGVAPTPFYVGLGTLALGLVLVAVGLRFRKRELGARALSAAAATMTPAAAPAAGAGAWVATPPPPAATGPPFQVPPGTGAILATVENRTASDESVQLLLNGAPTVSLTVPAGRSGVAHLRAPAAPAPGSSVRVEVVTASGARAGQDVTVVAGGTAELTLRLG